MYRTWSSLQDHRKPLCRQCGRVDYKGWTIDCYTIFEKRNLKHIGLGCSVFSSILIRVLFVAEQFLPDLSSNYDFPAKNSLWRIVLVGLDASGRIHTRAADAPSSIPRVIEINILIVVSYLLEEQRSCDGRGAAQRPVLRVNESKKTVASSAAKTH
jgi:hypothetical protein